MSFDEARLVKQMDDINNKLDAIMDVVRSDQADIKVLAERQKSSNDKTDSIANEMHEFKQEINEFKQELKQDLEAKYVTRLEIAPLSKLAWTIITAIVIGIGSFAYNTLTDVSKNTAIIMEQKEK